MGAQRVLSIFEHILTLACISTDHPQFLSFIPSVPSRAAVAFDLVVSASALYGGSWLEGASVVHAENEVLTWLGAEFGLPAGSGGVFVHGGKIDNLSALVAARDQARPRRSTHYPKHGPWAVICSSEAHSSIASAAPVMDIDVISIDRDFDGVLRADAVRAELDAEGHQVIAVVAITGSTNFGVIDDVAGIAELKADHDFWLHFDGAYGLSAMLSPAARPLFAGVGDADSLIVDPPQVALRPRTMPAHSSTVTRRPDAGHTPSTRSTSTPSLRPSNGVPRTTRPS